MKNCTNCNNKFTILDRFKSLLNGHLKCRNCNADYKSEKNLYRGIYFGVVYMLNIFIFNEVIIINNFLLKVNVQIAVILIMYALFDLIPHRLQRYKKVN